MLVQIIVHFSQYIENNSFNMKIFLRSVLLLQFYKKVRRKFQPIGEAYNVRWIICVQYMYMRVFACNMTMMTSNLTFTSNSTGAYFRSHRVFILLYEVYLLLL